MRHLELELEKQREQLKIESRMSELSADIARLDRSVRALGSIVEILGIVVAHLDEPKYVESPQWKNIIETVRMLEGELEEGLPR